VKNSLFLLENKMTNIIKNITAGEFEITDAFIRLREGQNSPLNDEEYSGIITKKYDGLNDAGLIFDKNGGIRVGDLKYNYVEVD